MFLALRELRHQKLRFGLISLIIFLIIFLVLFITGLARGLANDNGAAISESPATHYILEKGSQNLLSRSEITVTQAKKALAKLGSGTAFNVRQTTIQQQHNAHKKTDIAYFAMSAKSAFIPEATNGAKLLTSGNGILVSDKLKEDGYKVGDSLKDSTSGKSFKILGFVAGKTYAHSPVIYITTAQWRQINPQMTKLTYNAIATKASVKTLNSSDLLPVTKQTIIENVPGYSAEMGSLNMMLAFLYVISVVVLAVFFYVITIQKLREFGTLKALGTSTGYLARHLIYEIGLITIASVIIGLVAVKALSMAIGASLPFILTTQTMVATGALFLLIAIVSSLVSLVKIAKVDPVSAIGGNA